MNNLPDFIYEENLWQKGVQNIIGIDEVGRGSLAGPVVAGAAFAKAPAAKAAIMRLGIDDSKRLSASAREKLNPKIDKYFQTAIGESSVSEINNLGIVKATTLAMRRAVKNLQFSITNFQNKNKFFILVDGYQVRGLPGGIHKQKAIIKGDQKSISIAAASIIAKVYRDSLMVKLHNDFPKYKWNENKGYGTRRHIEAIKKHGICDLHREVFVD